jgi:peptidoglycan hydrolase CwlO-like protein
MNQEQIQQQYQALCAEFGHLTLIQRNTNNRLAEIESQIAKLNELAGKLNEQEAKNAAKLKAEPKRLEQSQAV